MRFCSLCSHGYAVLVTDTGVAACLPCAARCVDALWRHQRGLPPRPPPELPSAEPASEALPEKVADMTGRGKF